MMNNQPMHGSIKGRFDLDPTYFEILIEYDYPPPPLLHLYISFQRGTRINLGVDTYECIDDPNVDGKPQMFKLVAAVTLSAQKRMAIADVAILKKTLKSNKGKSK